MAIEYSVPSPEHTEEDSDGGAALQAQANIAVQHWLADDPGATDGLTETVRVHIHLRELVRRAQQAQRARQDAEQRDASLLTRHDPAGQRILGCITGTVLVSLLVILDAIPLNWAAQAFGLDSGGTWLVTFILVVASVGAMLGFELTSRHPRRRALLTMVVAVSYLVLLALRTQYLTTVAAESFPVAFLQSAMLTAISAALVLSGSAILSRTRSLSLTRSRAAVRRARRATAEARAAQNTAADNLGRHIGGLRQILLPWALGSAAPQGVDRAQWFAALEGAVHELFPYS
jgi:hypothetical protein